MPTAWEKGVKLKNLRVFAEGRVEKLALYFLKLWTILFNHSPSVMLTLGRQTQFPKLLGSTQKDNQKFFVLTKAENNPDLASS